MHALVSALVPLAGRVDRKLIEPIRLYSGDLIAPLWSPELPLRPKWQWLVPIVSYSLAEYTSPEMAVTSPEMAVAFRRGRANHIIRLVAYSPSWGGCRGAERTSVRGLALWGAERTPVGVFLPWLSCPLFGIRSLATRVEAGG